jgi:hypothetical protein
MYRNQMKPIMLITILTLATDCSAALADFQLEISVGSNSMLYDLTTTPLSGPVTFDHVTLTPTGSGFTNNLTGTPSLAFIEGDFTVSSTVAQTITIILYSSYGAGSSDFSAPNGPGAVLTSFIHSYSAPTGTVGSSSSLAATAYGTNGVIPSSEITSLGVGSGNPVPVPLGTAPYTLTDTLSLVLNNSSTVTLDMGAEVSCATPVHSSACLAISGLPVIGLFIWLGWRRRHLGPCGCVSLH